MTYCLGIMTRQGLVMASDSRTNAGYDQVNVCRKMHTFVDAGRAGLRPPDQRQPVVTQSVITLLRRDFDQGRGLAAAPIDLRRRPRRRRTGPPGRRPRPRSPGAGRVQRSTSTSSSADRSAASRTTST